MSPESAATSAETLAQQVPDLLPRVEWLDRLPGHFSGLVLANELLDAMPVSRFRIGPRGIEEGFVTQDAQGLREAFDEPTSPGLTDAVREIEAAVGPLAQGYVSEINLRQTPWLKMLAEVMHSGALLLIDYGYPQREYYHPQRNTGTLMCHYRHRAHPDPFCWVGLQDITSHVNFSALAKAGCNLGLGLAGYTTQAHFLMASGLDELLAVTDPTDLPRHMHRVQGVKRLTLPSEMGERFKVLGLVKGMKAKLRGFALRDLRQRL